MPIKTRSNKSVSENQTEISNPDKMAAKPELSFQDVLDQMTTSMTLLEKKLESKFDEHAKKIEATQKASENKLNQIEKNTSDISDRIVTLEKDVDTKTRRINILETKIEELEQVNRSHNVIIEGLQEGNNENLRSKLDDLFETLELPFDSEWVDTVY